MNSLENQEWEYLLDIDDFDLQLSAPLCLSNSSNTSFLQTQEIGYVDEKSTRRISGPAGIFQTGRIHKLRNFKDDPTQEYIRKLINNVSEDDDFKRRPWVTALEFINDGGEIELRYSEKTQLWKMPMVQVVVTFKMMEKMIVKLGLSL
ncbi:hypothetical protein Tco_0394015 [Tanacetum coccineum]